MACRGWYTALLPAEAATITTAADVDVLLAKLEDLYSIADADGRILSVDKSWDAMHRVLCGGWLDTKHGDPMLRACVIGGRQLSSRRDWIVSFVDSPLVIEVVKAIAGIQEDWFRDQYFALHRKPAGWFGVHRYEAELTQEDFDYTWAYFVDVRDFYGRAADRGLSTVFSVDQ
jgi:hypothetical protein